MSVMLDNVMSNFNSVTLGNVTLYFSYHTCIGVDDGKAVSVRANEWSKTTGKHINYLKNNSGAIAMIRKTLGTAHYWTLFVTMFCGNIFLSHVTR